MSRLEPRRRAVVTIDAAASLRETADRMRRSAVGTLVVTDAGRPAGIVTDRDLLERAVVARRDPARTRVAEVMSQPLVTAALEEPLEPLIARMAQHGVRRMPLLASGELAGMVSLDDVVVALSNELDGIAAAFRRSDWDAQRRRRRERPRAWLRERAGRVAARLQRSVEAVRRAWP